MICTDPTTTSACVDKKFKISFWPAEKGKPRIRRQDIFMRACSRWFIRARSAIMAAAGTLDGTIWPPGNAVTI